MSSPTVRLETIVSPREIPISPEPFEVSVILNVIAPGIDEGVQSRPLNLALVIDKSGSMRGSKMDTAKAAAIRVVEKLNEGDTFTLVTFNHEYEIAVPASRLGHDRSGIINQINQIQAGNQTKLAEALSATLSELRSAGGSDVVSSVYVLTDGKVHDANACLSMVPAFQAESVSLRAGGIGEDYEHKFLDQICTDPIQDKSKYLVEHISLENIAEELCTNFEEFLAKKGHVVTSNCRLSVNVPPNRATITGACAKEHARDLQLDLHHSANLGDLPAGGIGQYLFTMSVSRAVHGDLRLANFQLTYSLGGVTDKVEADAMLAIRNDPSVQPVHDPRVMNVVNRVFATRSQELAEKALEDGNLTRTTQLLDNAIAATRKTQDLAAVEQLEKQKELVSNAGMSDDEKMKKVREGTRQLSK